MKKTAEALLTAAIVLLLSAAAFAASPLQEIERAGVFPGFTLDTGNGTESAENGDLPILVGVVVTDSVKKAMFFDKDQKKRIEVKEGEEVSGFKVARILPDSVVLERGTRSFTVKIFSKEALFYRKRFSKAKFARTTRPSVVVAEGRSERVPPGRKESSRATARKGTSSHLYPKAKRTPPAPATRRKPPPFIKKLFGGMERRGTGTARSFIDLLRGLRKR